MGIQAVVRAPADGYTLLLVAASNTINVSLYDKADFNLLRDIAPVARIGNTPQVMEVTPSFPAKSVPEFIAYAKANPGKINMASGGVGNLSHVSGELFKMMAAVDMLHVPYRSVAPALTDLLSGQVQVMFDAMPSSIASIKAGKLARAGGDHADTLGGSAGCPDCGRFCAGVRDQRVVRNRRAKKHIGRDCRKAQQGNQCWPCRPKDYGSVRRPGERGACRHALRLRKIHFGRRREVGQGDQVPASSRVA